MSNDNVISIELACAILAALSERGVTATHLNDLLDDPSRLHQVAKLMRAVRKADADLDWNLPMSAIGGLGVHAFNVLMRQGVKTVGEIYMAGREELLGYPSMGKMTFESLEKALMKMGYPEIS